MNNFPAMTEAQRQELIQHATEEIRLKTEHIARLEKHMPGQFNTTRYQIEILIAQIVLAAMTAEPKAWIVHAHGGDQLTDDGDYVANAEGMHNVRASPLYTAPPAPVLRVPAGWKLVPMVPTEAMMLNESGCQHHAWDDAKCPMRESRRLIWKHMIEAAPEASNEQ